MSNWIMNKGPRVMSQREYCSDPDCNDPYSDHASANEYAKVEKMIDESEPLPDNIINFERARNELWLRGKTNVR